MNHSTSFSVQFDWCVREHFEWKIQHETAIQIFIVYYLQWYGYRYLLYSFVWFFICSKKKMALSNSEDVYANSNIRSFPMSFAFVFINTSCVLYSHASIHMLTQSQHLPKVWLLSHWKGPNLLYQSMCVQNCIENICKHCIHRCVNELRRHLIRMVSWNFNKINIVFLCWWSHVCYKIDFIWEWICSKCKNKLRTIFIALHIRTQCVRPCLISLFVFCNSNKCRNGQWVIMKCFTKWNWHFPHGHYKLQSVYTIKWRTENVNDLCVINLTELRT